MEPSKLIKYYCTYNLYTLKLKTQSEINANEAYLIYIY